jgi:hypothetical protein
MAVWIRNVCSLKVVGGSFCDEIVGHQRKSHSPSFVPKTLVCNLLQRKLLYLFKVKNKLRLIWLKQLLPYYQKSIAK